MGNGRNDRKDVSESLTERLQGARAGHPLGGSASFDERIRTGLARNCATFGHRKLANSDLFACRSWRGSGRRIKEKDGSRSDDPGPK